MRLLELISEKEIKETMLSEYRKKLILYKFTDQLLKKKYRMSFKEFTEKNIVRKESFSWQAENDTIE